MSASQVDLSKVLDRILLPIRSPPWWFDITTAVHAGILLALGGSTTAIETSPRPLKEIAAAHGFTDAGCMRRAFRPKQIAETSGTSPNST